MRSSNLSIYCMATHIVSHTRQTERLHPNDDAGERLKFEIHQPAKQRESEMNVVRSDLIKINMSCVCILCKIMSCMKRPSEILSLRLFLAHPANPLADCLLTSWLAWRFAYQFHSAHKIRSNKFFRNPKYQQQLSTVYFCLLDVMANIRIYYKC